MKHKIGFNRLQRSAAHRKALHRNMVGSLFRYERIKTTKAKALEIRRSAEKMITRAKQDSVHNRRMISRRLYDEGLVAKLFVDIAPRMKDRSGGYTRILKLGPRQGDSAEVVLLELVDYKLETGSRAKQAAKKPKSRGKAAKKPATKPKTSKEVKPAKKASDDNKPEAKADKKASRAKQTTAPDTDKQPETGTTTGTE